MNIINAVAGNTMGGSISRDVDRSMKAFAVKLEYTSDSLAVAEGNVLATLVAALSAIRVTIYITTRYNGQIKVATQMPLIALFEYAQSGEGVIEYGLNAAGTHITTIEGLIDLCDEGALAMHNDEQIRFQMENLPTAATFILTVDAIESVVADFEVNVYEQISVGTNQLEKTFQVDHARFILIPTTNGVVREVLFTGSNGANQRFIDRELRHITRATNDVCYYNPVRSYAVGQFYPLSIDKMTKLDINTNGTGVTMYLVSFAVVGKPSDVRAVNEKLVSTTEQKLMKQAGEVEQQLSK